MAVNELHDHDLKSAADYQQLIDDVESLMASPSGVDVETVGRLHARFDQAVKMINARLRDFDQLLKKGLRNEALERCEVEPKLLDLFLILDFPDRESWSETVRQCGFTPSELLVSVAAELSDAYAAEKPLAELKYQVRLHSLARSPLPIRISLIRKLAKQDPGTAIWEEDLKTFEKARHNQLAGEVQAAVKSGNMNVVAALFDELNNPDWIAAPAKSLVKQVSDAYAMLRRQHARNELRELEPELNSAFAAFDVLRGREVRQSWNKWSDLAALSGSDPLTQAVAPALQWLQDQDQMEQEQQAFDAATAGLSQALDKGAGRLVLEERYHALMALGRGIPDELKQRLEERLMRLDREKSRSMQLKIAGVAVAVSLVVSLVVFTIQNANYRNQVKAQAAVIQKMLDERQLPDAEAHLTKLEAESPRVAAAAEIQQLKGDLKVAQEKDAVRQVEFKGMMALARRDGVEQATLKTIPNALETLSKAWDVAVYSSEKAEVKEVSTLVETRQTVLKQSVDEQFASEFANQRRDFEQLSPAPLDNLAALEALKVEATSLAEREGISEELVETKARPFIAEVNVAIQKGLKLQSEARFVQEINASIGDRTKFFAQLERYTNSTEFVGTSRHLDFERVAKSDLPLLTGLQNWTGFLDSFMRRDLTSVDSITANKLRTDAEKLMKDHPGFAYTTQLQDAVTYLSKSATRERGSPIMEQLLALKMFKVFAARSDGKRYYFAAEPPTKDATGSFSVKYYTDTEFKTAKQTRLASVESDPGWRSPQLQFEMDATELLSKLRDSKGANWDQTFIELLGKLYNSPNMDPILKVQLIPYTLRAAADGSSFLPARLERVKSEIERENLNPSTNWVLPDDPEANQVRIRAETVLKRLTGDLKDIKPLLKEADLAYELLKRPRFDIRYVWTAWLHRDQANRWTCTFRGNTPLNSQQGELYVLSKSESGDVGFVRIGQLQQGQPKLDTNSAELAEGRPVFEKKPDPASGSKVSSIR